MKEGKEDRSRRSDFWALFSFFFYFTVFGSQLLCYILPTQKGWTQQERRMHELMTGKQDVKKKNGYLLVLFCILLCPYAIGWGHCRTICIWFGC